ncbi:uncharacterized protein LOC111527926 [Piliocolobus tephrosceles]|uniref:uncharacterized protein LOC111527926 n=1 Tax=Piliocolobus tephrosceles TaxID=591936 RepID=UPI000C2AFF74|nr:uncharacterized protein LOC111527926 [Piliocolobus tephrosceles]
MPRSQRKDPGSMKKQGNVMPTEEPSNSPATDPHPKEIQESANRKLSRELTRLILKKVINMEESLEREHKEMRKRVGETYEMITCQKEVLKFNRRVFLELKKSLDEIQNSRWPGRCTRHAPLRREPKETVDFHTCSRSAERTQDSAEKPQGARGAQQRRKSSPTKRVHKLGRSHFHRMHRSQRKDTENMKKQGNGTPPKEPSNSPAADPHPKETEDILERELNIEIIQLMGIMQASFGKEQRKMMEVVTVLQEKIINFSDIPKSNLRTLLKLKKSLDEIQSKLKSFNDRLEQVEEKLSKLET